MNFYGTSRSKKDRCDEEKYTRETKDNTYTATKINNLKASKQRKWV